MNRYVVTEFRRSLRASVVAVAILVLALSGPLLVEILYSSVKSFLQENARLALTADAAITAYRPIRDDEVATLRQAFQIKAESKEVEFLTMATSSKEKSALLEVHGVEPSYPLVGDFEFEDGSRSRADMGPRDVWVSRDAVVALGVGLGDTIRLGHADFVLTKIMRQAPRFSRGAFGFAPKVYVARGSSGSTGLLGFGSQVYHRVYVEFVPLTSTKTPLPGSDDLKKVLTDSDLFFRTPVDANQGLERFTGSVMLYLSLVALSLFVLGWTAGFYIFRTQSLQRLRGLAVSLVFGADQRRLVVMEFLRMTLLMVIAASASLAITWTVAAKLEPVIASTIVEKTASIAGVFRMRLDWLDIVGLIGVSLMSAVIVSLPLIFRLGETQLAELFSESPLQASEGRSSLRLNLILGSLMAFSLYFLSWWLLRDPMRSLQLTVGLLLTIGFVHVSGLGVFRFFSSWAARLQGSGGSLLRLVGVQLKRARFAVRLSFLAIGLATVVASSVGQMMHSLTSELSDEGRLAKTPDFFLFNIPESEVDSLKETVTKAGTSLDYLSPMILARLQTLNGKTIEKERFQKFPVRITWRDRIISSETLLEGEPLPMQFDDTTGEAPKVSVEERFAKENGMAIGDRLGFDVQGVPLEGEIANIRKIRWTDFNPNFFISFQAGVLEDAPKTWVANIKLPEGVERGVFQNDLIRKYPDLSVVNVGEALTMAMGMVQSVLDPAEGAAWLAGAFALLVLAAIVLHSTRLRSHEMNLFRILGAEPRRVRQLFRLEFVLAAGLASLVGSSLGLVLAWLASTRFLELGFQVDWVRFCGTTVLGAAIGLGLGEWLFSRSARGLGIDRRVV